MKLFSSFCFLLLSITGIAQTFPKKYVDSLTAVVLSRKSNYPLALNNDSAVKLMWQPHSSADRITMFYDIVENSNPIATKHVVLT